jgi:hypothetical protein
MRRLHSSAVPGKQVKISGSATIPYVDFLGKKLYVLTTAITSGVTTDSTGAATGDFAVTTNATGRNKWFVSDGTNWVAIGDGGAGFTQAAVVAAPGALTSAAITGGESPTEAEHNALQADVAALRTTVAAILTSLKAGSIMASS